MLLAGIVVAGVSPPASLEARLIRLPKNNNMFVESVLVGAYEDHVLSNG